MDNGHDGKQALKPITVRFPEDVWQQIDKMAKEHDTNKTELVRRAAAGNLHRYLGNIRIIDDDQAREIKELIKALFDEVSAVRMELHRIGINYNQEIRLRQIERKYAKSGMDPNTIFQRHDEEAEVKKECKAFSQKDLDALIARYEKATEKVGKMLCRILA